MLKLTEASREKARAFIFTQARPLERRRYAYHFEEGSRDAVMDELAHFQNEDGGFGRGLEPDLQTPASSALATTVGLQILHELEAGRHNLLVRGAMRYLLSTYDAERQYWPIIPVEAAEAPHAPWWNVDASLPERFGDYLINPRAEIVGYLHEYAELAPADLRDELTETLMDMLDSASDEMAMHEFLCFKRFVATPTLPDTLRSKALDKLTLIADKIVVRDRASWSGYGLLPLDVADSPYSPFAQLLADEVEQNLDHLIEQQGADGAWAPVWSWGEQFPQAWGEARVAWSGMLTLQALLQLYHFGRLE